MSFVTIGIPTYKQPQYVKEAVESALRQSYQDLEVIVSDDSPDDEVEAICSKYLDNPKFKYYHNRPAYGRVANYRHLLYDLAQSPFFLCLDGDDYLVDDKYIERAVNDLLNDPQKILIFANSITYFQERDCKIYDQNNGPVPTTVDGDWFFINFWRGFGMNHQTILYNRQLAMDLDFYRYDISSADWESFLRLIQGHKLGHQAQAVAVWRKHGSNETRNITLESILNNRKSLITPIEYAKNRKVFSDKELDTWHRRMMLRFYVKSLLRLIFTGQKDGVRELKKFIRAQESPVLFRQVAMHPLVIMAKINRP